MAGRKLWNGVFPVGVRLHRPRKAGALVRASDFRAAQDGTGRVGHRPEDGAADRLRESGGRSCDRRDRQPEDKETQNPRRRVACALVHKFLHCSEVAIEPFWVWPGNG